MTTHSSGIFILLLAACAAFAGDDIPTKRRVHAVSVMPAARTSAQRVFLDPLTAQPRSPTTEEREQLQRQNDNVVAAKSAESSPDNPRVLQFSDGAVGVYLNKPNMIRAQIAQDGRVKMICRDQPSKKVRP